MAALLLVMWIPEIALAAMAVPLGTAVRDPYIGVMLMVGASLIGAYMIVSAPEIAVIMCAMALNSSIIKALHWMRIRDAVAAVA